MKKLVSGTGKSLRAAARKDRELNHRQRTHLANRPNSAEKYPLVNYFQKSNLKVSATF